MAHADEYNHELDLACDAMKRAKKAERGIEKVNAKIEAMNAINSYMRNFMVDDTALDMISLGSVYASLYSDINGD